MQRIVVVVVAQLQLPLLLSFSLLFMLILSSFLPWPFVGGGFYFWLANAAYGFNEANTKLLKLDLHASLYSPSLSLYIYSSSYPWACPSPCRDMASCNYALNNSLENAV